MGEDRCQHVGRKLVASGKDVIAAKGISLALSGLEPHEPLRHRLLRRDQPAEQRLELEAEERAGAFAVTGIRIEFDKVDFMGLAAAGHVVAQSGVEADRSWSHCSKFQSIAARLATSTHWLFFRRKCCRYFVRISAEASG